MRIDPTTTRLCSGRHCWRSCRLSLAFRRRICCAVRTRLKAHLQWIRFSSSLPLPAPYPAKAFGGRRKRKKDKNKTDPRREIDSNANILLVPRPTDTFDFSFPHSEKVREAACHISGRVFRGETGCFSPPLEEAKGGGSGQSQGNEGAGEEKGGERRVSLNLGLT